MALRTPQPLLPFTLHLMHHEFYCIGDLLAYLRQATAEITEGYCRIGNVSSGLAEEILTATGLDVRGFALVLDRSGIQHTLKQHGTANAASEIAQGQVPIEEADFMALADWLPTPKIVRRGQARPGRFPMPCMELYAANPSGLVCAVMEYRPGRRRLALATMYKKRPTT